VSEDPARKRLVLSEEAEAVPAESECSGADNSQHLSKQGKRNKTPVGTARDPKIHLVSLLLGTSTKPGTSVCQRRS